jgi:glyoxylase-like metal-dependent hydrolase (beta-lactamase superfamily II)
MEEINEVGEKIYQVQVRKTGLDGLYTVYIITEEQGVLIDPGPGSIVPSIQKAMKTIGLETLAYIIPTHIHIDHGGGTGVLADLFTDARVVLHENGKKHFVDPTRLIASTRMAFGDDFESFLGPLLPIPESRVIVPEDGDEICVEGRKLRIIHAPGHAPHHIAVFDEKTQGLFCGEALGKRLPSDPSCPLPCSAPPGFDMDVYLDTIKKLEAIKPKTLFYAHDGVADTPEDLIPRVAENTRIFGEKMLEILQNSETDADALSSLHDFIVDRFGIAREDLDEKMAVGGFRLYYKRKGLLS